ncbi:Uncharacterized protein C4orf37 [Habropoda laboriosa]|uniref:Uncharacterized protein C4orf37 n=1 Tax=Habropoda laboriosa TaxID=597456 RepID=A0A0L7QT59_9HYME|nr:Uncharacterized protein C4orf37 [Habropoda laboriosa]
MAYDRTKRFPKLIIQTLPKIGPGTYDTSYIPRARKHLDEFYPFLCGAKRKTVIISKDAEKFPGPGFPHKNYTGYTINEYGTLVKKPAIEQTPTGFYNVTRGEINSTTLMYKGNFWSRMSGRKGSQFSSTPGPGDYQHEKEKTPAQMQDERVREEKRMTSRQPRFLDVLYRRKIRENLPAPNRYKVKGHFDKFFKISCKCDPYTLEPAPFGRTAKVRFDDKMESDIPGPGTYDPPLRLKCVASIYPAPFGVCAGRFKKVVEDIGPGPSDYHSNVGNLAYEVLKRYKYAHYKSTQPQMYFNEPSFHEEQCNIVEIPGKIEEKKSSVYHAAFKSRTKRFKSDKTYVPDPGAYEVLTAFKTNRDKCDFLCRRSAPPFGTRSRRSGFCDITMDTPDPTSYHLATDVLKNAKGGSMARSIIKEETPRAPGPTRYCHPTHPWPRYLIRRVRMATKWLAKCTRDCILLAQDSRSLRGTRALVLPPLWTMFERRRHSGNQLDSQSAYFPRVATDRHHGNRLSSPIKSSCRREFPQ